MQSKYPDKETEDTERFAGKTLLTLKMTKGAAELEMQAVSKNWER